MIERRLTETVSVAPQIALEDLPALKADGVATIISNRPDGEEPGQPSAAAVRAAAHATGLDFVHIPMATLQVSEDDVAAFAEAAAASEGRTLAFCKSGTRSAILWALSERGRMPARDILARAAEAGYDLSGLAPQLGPPS